MILEKKEKPYHGFVSLGRHAMIIHTQILILLEVGEIP